MDDPVQRVHDLIARELPRRQSNRVLHGHPSPMLWLERDVPVAAAGSREGLAQDRASPAASRRHGCCRMQRWCGRINRPAGRSGHRHRSASQPAEPC